MNLYKELDITECDSVSDFVHTLSQETDVDEEEFWKVASAVLSDADFLENARNELRLRNLFMLHLSVNGWDGTGRPPGEWVEMTIPLDGEEDSSFSFSYGAFSVPVKGDGLRVEMMKRVAEDEGLEIDHCDEGVVATTHHDCDSARAIRITSRILHEVYEIEFADVVSAEEVVTGSGRDGSDWDEMAEWDV